MKTNKTHIMKKISIIIFCLMAFAFWHDAYSQYSIPLRLVNSDGTPKTGQASNITFRRYPHGSGDGVSGLTITEVGTAGNYVCKGFTTYEYVTLWLSGVQQTWFDSVQVGSVTSYINTLLGSYMNKTGTQTGFTGSKTLTGDWLWTSGTITLNKPYIYTSSPWYTDYSLIGSSSLIWKGLGDSLYGTKPYYISGTSIILLSANKIWGTGLTTPIPIKSSLTFETGVGLGVTLPYQQDSLYVKKDTTIAENSYTKSWNLKRRFWSQTDSLNLYWYYKNTYANTKDSFAVINNSIQLEESSFIYTVDSTQISAIDTFSFTQTGFYDIKIPFEYEFEYVTPNNTCYDSLFVAIYEGDITDDEKLDYFTIKYAYTNGVAGGSRGRGYLSFSYRVTNASIANTFYIGAKTSGICHTSGGSAKVWMRRYKIETLRVK